MVAREERFRGELKDILLRENVVSQDILNTSLREQEKNKKPIIEILLNTGKTDEKKLMMILSKMHGYTAVNPSIFIIDKEILSLIPRKIAEEHTLLPVSRFEHTLTV